MKKNVKILIALSIPIVVLGILTMNHYLALKGHLVTLPVRGYDPRDLLSGHYIQFTVEYPKKPNCEYDKQSIKACLDDSCKTFIKGTCHRSRFLAGIERFYIPQDNAKELESSLRNSDKKTEIVVSVSKNGKAAIKEFLINGCPWDKYLDKECQ